MRYRPLGESGLMVSVLGLGGNNFGRPHSPTTTLAGARVVVEAAVEAGITFFDAADTYGRPRGTSEDLLGQCLLGHRDNVVLATKFGSNMEGGNGPDWGARGSRRYIRRAVHASLRRLRTDYIDLYYYHMPDGVTPIEETLTALHELVIAGLVRYVGCSNMSAWQVVEAEFTARALGVTRFISAQNQYSLLDREVEVDLLPVCERYGLGFVPAFPLANGLLTGKHRRDQPPAADSRLGYAKPAMHADADWDRIEALTRYAKQRGITLLEVAIGGLAAQPAVASVIAGATSPEQVAANVAASDWEPTAEDLAALAEL